MLFTKTVVEYDLSRGYWWIFVIAHFRQAN